MKKKLLQKLTTLALVGLGSPLFAQTPATPEPANTIKTDKTSSIFRTMSFGINAGTLFGTSVVSTRGDFSNYSFKPGYGFFLKKQVGHTLGFQADFLAGTLRGSNSGRTITTPWTYDTDLNWSASFSTTITFGNISFLHQKSAFLPYGTIGAGIIDYSSVLTSKANVKSKAETGRMLFIPISIGTKIVLSSVINLDLGYKIGFVDADNFDAYRNSTQKDNFSYGYAGLEFILGKKSRPALGKYNPITGITQKMNEKYDDLKKQMDSEKAAIADENARIQAENAKLMEEQKKFMTDSDNDGVSDYFDKCPATPTTTKVDGAGCPLPSFVINKPADVKVFISEADRNIVKEAIKNLEFDLAKATIRPVSFESLDKVANLIVAKNFSLKLAGHTDSDGSNAANLSLSKNRAEAIKTYLVSKGANPSRIEATGYGETQPIASNKTAKGKQTNRRVEFTIY
ncbi:MAG: OmpA family protein [Sphingobacteriales bacterium]|nr:MAG: OmpA family protein [Sphingobacteriales bacterium]TAF80913.1 MAG: OmpA family protein [Sphingobacteriales bacterium]